MDRSTATENEGFSMRFNNDLYSTDLNDATPLLRSFTQWVQYKAKMQQGGLVATKLVFAAQVVS